MKTFEGLIIAAIGGCIFWLILIIGVSYVYGGEKYDPWKDYNRILDNQPPSPEVESRPYDIQLYTGDSVYRDQNEIEYDPNKADPVYGHRPRENDYQPYDLPYIPGGPVYEGQYED